MTAGQTAAIQHDGAIKGEADNGGEMRGRDSISQRLFVFSLPPTPTAGQTNLPKVTQTSQRVFTCVRARSSQIMEAGRHEEAALKHHPNPHTCRERDKDSSRGRTEGGGR